MKKKLLLLILTMTAFSFITKAQTFTDNLLGITSTNARTAIAADLDGDGDQDILIASQGTNDIAWFENTDGLGTFSSRNTIGVVPNAYFAVAGDLDGDGDLDVVASSNSSDRILWFENDGSGAFTSSQVITTLTNGVAGVFIADVNGDGFLDVISASYLDDKIAYYQNDGTGTFATQNVIAVTNGAISVYAADMDGDGDIDILSASALANTVSWHENTGSGSFATMVNISTTVTGATSVYAADVDGDGDMDVLSAAGVGDRIAWFENDGSGVFGPKQTISTTVDRPFSVSAADMDGDGDMDVLSASFNDDKIAWFKNTNGLGSFGPAQIISNVADGASFVSTADIDGDGDMDVLSSSYYDHSINWYENVNFLVSSISIQGQGGVSTITTQGGTLQMNATVLPANADDATYTWSVSNGTGSATISTNGLLTATSNGTVTVSATANDGSGVIGTKVITSSNQILLYSIIVQEGADSTITTNGGTLQMYAIVLPFGADDNTYTWSVNNGTGSATISTSGLLTATADGTVDVIATANDASGVTGSKTITISNQTVGIQEVLSQNLSIHPNPANNQISFNTSEPIESISIINISGKRVVAINTKKDTLDISVLVKGIYFLQIQTKNGVITNKFIKK